MPIRQNFPSSKFCTIQYVYLWMWRDPPHINIRIEKPHSGICCWGFLVCWSWSILEWSGWSAKRQALICHSSSLRVVPVCFFAVGYIGIHDVIIYSCTSTIIHKLGLFYIVCGCLHWCMYVCRRCSAILLHKSP